MKIFITGGCGFIGSNFVLQSSSNMENILLNYDSLTYAGNIANLNSIQHNSNYKFINGDICNINDLKNAILKFKPDVIIHFAAETHVDRSIDSPLGFIKTNILGTTNILSCIMHYLDITNNEDFKFIHISTDEVYGSLGDKGFFNEKTSYKPNSPYSASKASADHLVRAWNRTYGLPSITINCSNNYGPFQFPEKLIPLIIANCIDEKPLPIYGDGQNIRDWLYVKDHCDAINAIIRDGTIGESYNIGGNNEIKNIDLVKIICSSLDGLKPRKNNLPYEELITFVRDRPGHDYRYAIDFSKVRKNIGWEPKETFETGINKTIKWYLNHEQWWRQIQSETYNQTRLGLKK